MNAQKITTMFAFVTTENDNGDEGIIATVTPSGVLSPMVGSDMDLLPKMTDHAEDIGLSYKIKFFKEVPRESVFN